MPRSFGDCLLINGGAHQIGGSSNHPNQPPPVFIWPQDTAPVRFSNSFSYSLQGRRKKNQAMKSLTATGLAGNLLSYRTQSSSKSHPCSFFQSAAVGRTRPVFKKWVFFNNAIRASTPSETKASASPGLYSSQVFDLTAQNVDLVLEDVRPYLISDGGNVDVVSVEDGVIYLKLQG